MTSPQLKNRQNYDILDPLGGGAFGTVYKIRIKEDSKEYALKIVNLNRPGDLDDAIMEYNLLRKGIPNVVKSFGSYHEEKKEFIFSTELMVGNLQEFIRDNGPLPFKKFIPIFTNIITGRLYFLVNLIIFLWLGLWGLFQSAKTIHKDLKPENILLNARGEAFIADLDGAKIYNSITSAKRLSEVTSGVGTPKWMSPEIRGAAWLPDFNTELPKTDIFSIGLIACFCIDTAEFNHKLSPILSEYRTNMTKQEVLDHLKKLEKELLAYLEDFRLRNLNSPNSLSFYYKIKTMLSFSPCARPSIQQLYEDFPVLSNNLVDL